MTSQNSPVSKKALWAGYIMSVLPVLLMIFSAITKLTKQPMVVKGFGESGFAESLIVPIGAVELICTFLYIFPKTAVLGAILLAGYLGGAVAVSMRAGQPWIFPALIGVLLWGGLFFRDLRIRQLIPITK